MASITVRFPEDVHAAVRDAAAKDSRSINGQIIWLLRRALETEGGAS